MRSRYCDDSMDMFAHLTNTAYGAKDINFEEKKYVKVHFILLLQIDFVQLLDDLPEILMDENRVASRSAAGGVLNNIRRQINDITGYTIVRSTY